MNEVRRNVIILIVLFGTAISLFTLCACNGYIPIFGNYTNNYKYPDAEKYSKGDRTIAMENVQKIDISWLAGTVKVSENNLSSIVVSETSEKPLGDGNMVRTLVENGTLHIKFMDSVENLAMIQKKNLYITLPSALVLDKLTADTSSAELEISNCSAKEIVLASSSGKIDFNGSVQDNAIVSTTSGDVDIDLNGDISSVNANSTSGRIDIDLKGDTSSVNVHSTSGRIDVNAEKCGQINAISTSGRVTVITDSCDDGYIKTSSGRITVKAQEKFANCKIVSSSGSVFLDFPTSFGLMANYKTSSGNIHSSAAIKTSGNRIFYGNEENVFDISTSSGNLNINIDD